MNFSLQNIFEAQKRLQNVAHKTPVMTSSWADKKIQSQLFFKCENLQRMGAFKFRGAYNTLAKACEQQPDIHGFVAFSSGNHAQAVALAAQLLNKKSTIVMPEDAPQIKVQATLGYGANVIFYNRYTEDRELITQKIAFEEGLLIVPPFNHPDVLLGQGTCAAELLQDHPDLDFLLVCLGGGGLLSGCALAAKHLAPHCQVIGVEPEAGNDGQQSFDQGYIVKIPTPKTIADGAQTQSLGTITFPLIQKYVADIWTVSDTDLIQAQKFMASTMKLITEPTGCLAAAAALFLTQIPPETKADCAGRSYKIHPSQLKNKKVGIILSGGNVDLKKFGDSVCY